MMKSSESERELQVLFPELQGLETMERPQRREMIVRLIQQECRMDGALLAIDREIQRLMGIKRQLSEHPEWTLEELAYPGSVIRGFGEQRGLHLSSPVERACEDYPLRHEQRQRELDMVIQRHLWRRDRMRCRKEWVDAVMEQLTQRERFIIHKHDLERLVWDEVVASYNETMPTPRERRALMRLRNHALDHMATAALRMMGKSDRMV